MAADSKPSKEHIMSIKIATAALIMMAGSSLHAAALEGYDGDNNPVAGASRMPPPASDGYASIRKPAPRGGDVSVAGTKAGQSNAVYWRGRLLGVDPDPQVRLRILREAIGG
jgi:hypothetical protein